MTSERRIITAGSTGSVKLAYITQWFAPEPAGPATWIARSLNSKEVEVCGITAVPNYPTGVTFQGYRTWKFRQEENGGVNLTRCPVYPSHDNSAVKRTINYLSFAISATVLGRKVLRTCDVALVYSSPETAAIPALIAHARYRLPYVLLVQDLWPETVLETGFLNSFAVRVFADWVLSNLDRTVCRRASRIVVISPGMKQNLIQRGVPAEKITIMFNWVDEEVLFPHTRTGSLRTQLGIAPNEFLFAFAGNHGAAQGLDAWLGAISHVQDLTDVHFLFLGEGSEKSSLIELADRLNLQRVHFLSQIPVEEYAKLAADTDAQIISLKDSPLFKITIPGKVQSSMAMAKALIASVEGDAANVIQDAGAGFVAKPGDPFDIAVAIRKAHAQGQEKLIEMGNNARNYYLEHMSQKRGTAILSSLIKQLTPSGS